MVNIHISSISPVVVGFISPSLVTILRWRWNNFVFSGHAHIYFWHTALGLFLIKSALFDPPSFINTNFDNRNS